MMLPYFYADAKWRKDIKKWRKRRKMNEKALPLHRSIKEYR